MNVIGLWTDDRTKREAHRHRENTLHPHRKAPGSGTEHTSDLQAVEMLRNSLCVDALARWGCSKTGTTQPTNGFHSLQRKKYSCEAIIFWSWLHYSSEPDKHMSFWDGTSIFKWTSFQTAGTRHKSEPPYWHYSEIILCNVRRKINNVIVTQNFLTTKCDLMFVCATSSEVHAKGHT